MNKYEIIANEMRDRIKNNVYPIDQPIPDEVSLAKEFNSSRMTMKRALDNLVAEGLLFRKRGHGTFIIQSAIQDDHVHVVSNEILGLTNLLKDKKSKVRSFSLKCNFPLRKWPLICLLIRKHQFIMSYGCGL
ncbi:GntR family transcriptional regulator [Bacillus spizizenii]|nr:GntR family transcriptional regulator [Bacillus spizizenii]